MLAVASLVAALTTAPAAPAPHELSLERIFSDPPLAGSTPTQLQLAPGGAYVSFLKGSAEDSDVLDLWGAHLPDEKPHLLVAAAALLGGKEQKLTEQERMQLERKRIGQRGITSYLWCGDDAKALVFPFSGDLYHVTLTGGGAPTVERLTNDEGVPELNPVCSRSGKKIAYVKADAVHVLDVKSKRDVRITPAGSAVHHYGLPEFIAEEEMDRHEGMWWSPDEKSLLVFEVDESPVAVKVRPQIFADHTEMYSQRYPAAGAKNALVTAWLVSVDGAHRTRLRTPKDDGYLPRAGFFPDGAPWIEWQSRDQRTLDVFEAARSGALRRIFEETDPAWIDLSDDFVPLKDGKRALWSTEKSGRRQIVVVDRKTGATSPLTDEPEPVKAVEAVDDDAGLVFYTAWRDRGRQLRAFSIPLAGGAATELTPEKGWHAVTFDDAGKHFVDLASDFGTPPTTTVRDAKTGKPVLVLDDNPAAELASAARSKPVWLDVTAADGKTVLNGLLLPPVSRGTGRKAPVIVAIYGGPTAETVLHAWTRSFPMWTYWTEHGFGVFAVDNRGMAGRDRAFTRAHLRAFGDVEVKDLFAAAAQLPKLAPWVDPARLGVFGWSYGGFLSARAILDEHTPFAASVAVAPVTDWTLYDTHYTERYLGTPQSDPDAYARANLVGRAHLLAKPFLLLHGTADDNVLFEHSLRLIEALEQDGKPFQLMIYPGKAHGIAGKASQRHVYDTITRFFEDKLER